ncbi:unannotated protein [freshwater metagenome]|uniref:Unannotated protein n=1 Tax=freshwater metagenome TaxID=449393 RepID=A0A6J7C567_9ZZZZ
MRLNCGTIRDTITAIAATSTPTLTTMSHASPMSCLSAMMIPPTHMIGADTIIVQVSRTSICTCWTSLVVRVMSEGAPNRVISRAENEPTRWKTEARTSRPKAIELRAPYQTAAIVHTTCTKVTASMTAPIHRM